MKDPSAAVCSRFHKAVELIGGRWTGAVIQVLLRGPTRYAAIRSAIPDISDRMLSDRLRILEAEGVVEREVVPETPVRVEYRLTKKGRSLEQALGAIASWANEWVDPAPVGQADSRSRPADDDGRPAMVPSSNVGLPRDGDTRHLPGKPRIKPKMPA